MPETKWITGRGVHDWFIEPVEVLSSLQYPNSPKQQTLFGPYTLDQAVEILWRVKTWRVTVAVTYSVGTSTTAFNLNGTYFVPAWGNQNTSGGGTFGIADETYINEVNLGPQPGYLSNIIPQGPYATSLNGNSGSMQLILSWLDRRDTGSPNGTIEPLGRIIYKTGQAEGYYIRGRVDLGDPPFQSISTDGEPGNSAYNPSPVFVTLHGVSIPMWSITQTGDTWSGNLSITPATYWPYVN